MLRKQYKVNCKIFKYHKTIENFVEYIGKILKWNTTFSIRFPNETSKENGHNDTEPP